ncbi:MAG: thioredoxin domain-containing protein [Anaerolineae bacterium]
MTSQRTVQHVGSEPLFSNRLSSETSPYLRQHAHNPVDWYPWGEEALTRARDENKPILLSIGYSTCHWCHVMAHESFEDPDTAALMNRHFINIKVDREERPDLDAIYMDAVQAMTGSGGWPMTLFLAPDGVPFYAGTYFPPAPRYGMPSFRQLLLNLAAAYQRRPQDIQRNAEQIRQMLRQATLVQPSSAALTPQVLDHAYQDLAARFDTRDAGFGQAPKFPPSMALEFLLRYHARSGQPNALAMAEQTLEHMARGGIYDQLGGGFHRYATDDHWLVPHFEKMLYDNAQLARVYALAFQITGKPLYRQITEEILAYVLREMTSPEGGFYTAQDADSEGEEGKFFVWTQAEVRDLLGQKDAELFGRYYDVTARGNFEMTNILHVEKPLAVVASQAGITPEHLAAVIERGRAQLFAARQQRVAPGLDDKVLTSWNGLMLATFADAARILGRDDYRQVALAAATFLLSRLRDPQNGRLLRTYRDGQAKLSAYLEDYALLAEGLLALYQATFDLRWLHEAQTLADLMLEHFWDADLGAFFSTSDDHETLIARPKEVVDNAMPSANASAAGVLLHLGRLLGHETYERHGVAVLQLLHEGMMQAPGAFSRLLCVLDSYLAPPAEIAIIGAASAPDTQALLTEVWRTYLPNTLVAVAPADDRAARALIPMLAGRDQVGGQATAYVCENHTCQLPVNTASALRQQLTRQAPARKERQP